MQDNSDTTGGDSKPAGGDTPIGKRKGYRSCPPLQGAGDEVAPADLQNLLEGGQLSSSDEFSEITPPKF